MDELIPLLAIFFAVGVPAVSLATHFVLRPLVKDIVGALRTGTAPEVAALQERIAALEEELAHHGIQIHALNEAESFRHRLETQK